MSLAVAAARRDSAVTELRERYDDVVREHERPAIGASGQPSAYLAERQKMLLTQMRSLEDDMAELTFLEGEALVANFNPPPAVIPEGANWTDGLHRGQQVGRQVVVSVDVRPLPGRT
jgi:hypothetical protein